MWNVYQYCKDFASKKISDVEFIDTYKRQRPLKQYVIDSYNDVLFHNYKDEYIKLNGILFPNDKFNNIDEFIINNKDNESIRKVIRAIVIILDKIYKS